jgi:G3E family GTPase
MRLTVLGGFLGSGKTTWLRHQLHHGVFKGAFVIVNEAAETPVDDALLQGSSKLAVLAGRCACCAGKADLISLLRKICDDRSKEASSSERLERIILETSGLADPGPIVEAIRSDPILVHHILVSEILVTVDALHGLSQLRSEPLGRRQIEIADCMMITKPDEANETELATLRVLNRLMPKDAALLGSGVCGRDRVRHERTLASPQSLVRDSISRKPPCLCWHARYDLTMLNKCEGIRKCILSSIVWTMKVPCPHVWQLLMRTAPIRQNHPSQS